MVLKNLFSLSSLATALTGLYLYVAVKNLHRLMFPLHGIDISAYGPEQLVRPLWKAGAVGAGGGDDGGGGSTMSIKAYLSTHEKFTLDFVKSEFGDDGEEGEEGGGGRRRMDGDTVLLWEDDDAATASSSLARSFILSTEHECGTDDETCDASAGGGGDSSGSSRSFELASRWLDDAEEKHALETGSAGVVTAMHHAGEGIESTSLLLSLYHAASSGVARFASLVRGGGTAGEDGEGGTDDASETKVGEEATRRRVVVPIPPDSPIWRSLVSNSTVNVHVVLTRHGTTGAPTAPPANAREAAQALQKAFKSHNTLLGRVCMVKYDSPHHIHKPRRVLYHDLTYLIRRYVLLGARDEPRPWDASATRPTEHRMYERALQMKRDHVAYPYWKPEVSVKFVSDDAPYPMDLITSSGMEAVRLRTRSPGHESGIAYLPGLHVDEIGLTSEKYVPLNGTVTALPLRISFDRNDIEEEDGKTGGRGGGGGASQGGLSPARWRLLSHFSQALESQKQMGFEQSDIDDLRRLIAETNVTLLGITVLASTLHLLFEFLTFKTDVEFWKGNKDLTGLSIRALFMDFASQFIILLYLIEMDSSLLMTVPSGIGLLIALWKCQRGSGLKFVMAEPLGDGEKVAFYNRVFRITGYELSATRLKVTKGAETKGKNETTTAASSQKSDSVDLVALSIETDEIATRTLGKYFLLPVVLGYTMHSLIMEQHSGWYSWLITSASSAVYALGFVMMTPQLFLNYKLKSVAHLPWKVLGFRFINTFIDDLFAFIIRMPTMARISCFRDDVVFFIYLYQRWLYPVDTSRPVEGGGMDAISAAAATEASSTAEIDEKEKKRQ